MRQETRQCFNKLMQGYQQGYGVDDISKKFSVTPSLAQQLVDEVVESSDFLQSISVRLVDDMEGQTVSLGVTGGVTSSTDTAAGKKRSAKNVLSLKGSTYRCNKVHSDVSIHFDVLDQWQPRFPDFHQRYRSAVRKAIALDMIRIGWFGTHYAANSDIEAFPNMEDVNVGWLQTLRDQKPENVVDEIVEASGQIRIGEGGDFVNLDMAVHQLLELIPTHKRTGLVVLVGSTLMSDDKAKLYIEQGSTPTEKQLIELEAINKTYGGLRAFSPAFFPNRGVMICRLSDLAIMPQRGTQRKSIEEKQDEEKIIDWNGRREAYGIADLDAAAMFEFSNVKIKDAAGNWV